MSIMLARRGLYRAHAARRGFLPASAMIRVVETEDPSSNPARDRLSFAR